LFDSCLIIKPINKEDCDESSYYADADPKPPLHDSEGFTVAGKNENAVYDLFEEI
jgi:hypothetical protein